MSTDIAKERDLIQQGDEADVLLKNDVFNKTINNLVENVFQQFVNSQAEDEKSRERIYNHYRALVDIVHTLQQRVAVRDEILAKDDSDNNGE